MNDKSNSMFNVFSELVEAIMSTLQVLLLAGVVAYLQEILKELKKLKG